MSYFMLAYNMHKQNNCGKVVLDPKWEIIKNNFAGNFDTFHTTFSCDKLIFWNNNTNNWVWINDTLLVLDYRKRNKCWLKIENFHFEWMSLSDHFGINENVFCYSSFIIANSFACWYRKIMKNNMIFYANNWFLKI